MNFEQSKDKIFMQLHRSTLTFTFQLRGTQRVCKDSSGCEEEELGLNQSGKNIFILNQVIMYSVC